jgi:hypothetical protein
MACIETRDPISRIVPPHILEAIARNGSPAERARALRTLGIDTSLRSARLIRAARGATARAAVTAGPADKQRTVFTASNTWTLPGFVVRSEGQGPSGDTAVDEAYDGLGATFDLYWNVYGRTSIDDAGLPLLATVHYGVDYDNAFWDGQRMVFGDGDGQYFNRFTIAVDIIGHELAHGVTGATAALEYHDQPGALNESLSDVFGSLVKQYSHTPQQTADQADWLIGAGLFTPQVNGVALRSMKAPGTAYDDPVLGRDPQPGHMRDYVNTPSDNGGVHINSGIPNRAFYLLAVALGGFAWERAGRIWYETLRDPRLTPIASFQEFAELTVDVAGNLFGVAERQAVVDAWQQVGITVQVPVGGNLHLAAVNADGRLWHSIRFADGSWQPFGDVEIPAGEMGDLVDVAVAAVGPTLHLVAITAGGRLWHTIRFADGSWQPFGDVEIPAGEMGDLARVAVGGVGPTLHLAVVNTAGRMWHTIRFADGSWQSFGDVEIPAGEMGDLRAVAIHEVGPPV